ncbi:OLC1v1037775C1 [Oldenlandia corymbosa var. corymbosa]|uniref:OLC1v1037775C1 n=1 Tax=Oldenlandia corymbosa var. corymbosa TaxID=529605 RepID=A0AAV1CYW7_OLDCO|nr:OLC1v1037775C1 [Oldenlandia corymbosa var. corymbosa]
MKRSSKLKRPVPDDVLDDIPDCAIDGIQKAVAPLRGTYRQFSFHLCHPYMTGGIPDSKAYSSFGESFRTEITKSKSIIALNAEEKLDLNKRFPNLTLKDLDVLKSLSHAVRTRVEALKKYQACDWMFSSCFSNLSKSNMMFEHDWLHGKFLKEKAALQDSDYNALCRRKKLLKQKARLDGPDYKTLCHQSKLDELGEEFIEKRAALVDKYHDLYQPLYTKRYDIVNGIVDVEGALNEASDRTKEDESSTKEKERGVPDFWLTAFKNKMVIFGNVSARTCLPL